MVYRGITVNDKDEVRYVLSPTKRKNMMSGSGIYLTRDRAVAGRYANEGVYEYQKKNEFRPLWRPHVFEAFVNIRKPLLNDSENKYRGVKKRKEAGYDGEFMDYDDTIVANSPNQIKSATDNAGTFSTENDDIRFRKADPATDLPLTEQEAALRDALAERLQEAGIEVEYVSEARLQELSKLSGAKLEAKRKSEARRKRDEQNHAIDYVASLITGLTEKEARQERLRWEQQHRDLAKEIYDAVLQGNFNDVTLQKINKYIDESTPKNPFGRRISQRVPQKMERSLHAGHRTNAVDALFTRISESAVGDAGTKLARNRSEREGAKEPASTTSQTTPNPSPKARTAPSTSPKTGGM